MKSSLSHQAVGTKFALFVAVTVVWCCTGAEVSIGTCDSEEEYTQEPTPLPPDDALCQGPQSDTLCTVVCRNKEACNGCCNAKEQAGHWGSDGGAGEQSCLNGCKNKWPMQIVIDVDFDPIGAKLEPNAPWERGAYVELPSGVYESASCECASALVAKESDEAILSDQIFSQIPSFMDSVDTRAFVEALTPCERAALYSDVVRWQTEIHAIDSAEFAALKQLIEAEVVSRLALSSRQGGEAFREEFNRMLGEIWYDQVVQTGSGYELVEIEQLEE
ncbi:hypothetical protein RAS2_08570 [Phycisphaerae bacterium RAS2]|nr:hypothetical protein RAS2_08570 [Phycisphaerae bacterium RAS2]